MDIHLHNTKTRKKERLEPVVPGRVGMYVCGPTVYDRAHLGNARPVIVFDVLYRLLRHVYGAENVRYVRNFTDVDDKIIKRAEETGREIGQITEETTRWYLEDMAEVGALEPDEMPRATEWIGAMVEMIEGLVAGGHAYEAEGHVLFRVRSYEAYGALSGRSVDDMIAGARVEVAPYKEDPMDFVLWKPAKDGEPGWEGPAVGDRKVGKGRPGWHIECSAMADALLGKSFDIHGGGNDLMFPHHENEIAQSKCAHPEGDFARIWMHNEMLQVEGKKMSKSLGNFFTVRDLLDQGVPGEVIRFVMLGTHYRKPMDWTQAKARNAIDTLREWIAVASLTSANADPEVVSSLADDLNTPSALTRMRELYSNEEYTTLTASAALIGFDLVSMKDAIWAQPFENRELLEGLDFHATVGMVGWGRHSQQAVDLVMKVTRKWLVLRWERNWQAADRLKNSALDAGLELRARKDEDGHTQGIANVQDGFDIAKLEALM